MTPRRLPFLLPTLLLLAAMIASCDAPPTPADSAPRDTRVYASRHPDNAMVETESATNPLRPPLTLFKDPISPALSELPSGALPVWRKYAAKKPPLLLLSGHPFLSPLAEEVEPAVRDLVRSGSSADLVRRGRLTAADTLFVSPETVSAAIAGGLISELDYVLPTIQPLEDFSLEKFQQRAVDAGFLSIDEAKALTLKDGVISGTVRGIPLHCYHPAALPVIDRPILVHIDLSFFKDLYVNEIKTPAYSLLRDTVLLLQERGYQAYAVTLSYSNQEALLSLETRFMISNLADVLRNPGLLQGDNPASWSLRSQAMYAAAMFAESKSRELIAQAAAECPNDPGALYAYALQLFSQKHSAKGFEFLDRAVALDPGYGYAYYDLAQSGVELGQVDKSLNLLEKAAQVLPDNPFIQLQLADLLLQSGQGDKALRLITNLQRLPWSEKNHPGILESLEEMASTVNHSRP